MNKTEDIKFSWWDTIKSLYLLLDTHRKAYFFYATVLILVLFYDLVPTLVIARIIDFFTSYSAGDSLSPFYYLTGFLAISSALVAIVRLTVKKRLANIRVETGYFARVKGFERLLDFSIKWHDNENTGNKVQRIQAGSDAAKQIQSLLAGDFFRQVTAIVGVLAAFIFMQPVFLIVSLIYIAIFWTVQLSFYSRMVSMSYENNILLEKAGGTYYEGLNNILTIKTLGVKDDFKKNINSREEVARDFSKRKIEMVNNKWKLFQIINALTLGSILYFAGMNFMDGAITIGSIFVVYNYYQKLNGAIADSTDTVDNLVTAKTAVARMMPVFWEKTTLHSGTEKFPTDWTSLQLENVSFTYPRKESLEPTLNAYEAGLHGVSITIPRNYKIGVVGRSGSGKSTLAKILLGLYETSGSYKIGGLEFNSIQHEEVTRNMSLVLQDSEMFNLSFKENITLMREWNEKLFAKAVSICELGELIARLPQGIDTLIGEKGYRLSGGERQRIGIARAIYRNPQILVLDEATSSLDDKTEYAIQSAIDTQLTEKTIITIAHRTSTLKKVDTILVFEEGRIVEQGTFDELSSNTTSKFYAIYEQEREQKPVSAK
jgi:ABC-type multidrug transport system fused ATPase/permease subunit